MSRDQKLMVKFVLPSAKRNDWYAHLCETGFGIRENPRWVRTEGDPPGFVPKGGYIVRGDQELGVQSYWNKEQDRYEITMGMPSVNRDMPLAIDVRAALSDLGVRDITDVQAQLWSTNADGQSGQAHNADGPANE